MYSESRIEVAQCMETRGTVRDPGLGSRAASTGSHETVLRWAAVPCCLLAHTKTKRVGRVGRPRSRCPEALTRRRRVAPKRAAARGVSSSELTSPQSQDRAHAVQVHPARGGVRVQVRQDQDVPPREGAQAEATRRGACEGSTGVGVATRCQLASNPPRTPYD